MLTVFCQNVPATVWVLADDANLHQASVNQSFVTLMQHSCHINHSNGCVSGRGEGKGHVWARHTSQEKQCSRTGSAGSTPEFGRRWKAASHPTPSWTLLPFRLPSILYMIALSHSSTCLLSRRGPAVLRRSADICSACQVRRNRVFLQGAHTVQSETHPTDVIHNSPADKSSSGGELLSSAHSAHNPFDCRSVSRIRDPKTNQLPSYQGNNIPSPLCRYQVLKLTYWQVKTRKTQMWTHIHVHSLPTFTHTYRGRPLYRHCKQMCMCTAIVRPSNHHQKENKH